MATWSGPAAGRRLLRQEGEIQPEAVLIRGRARRGPGGQGTTKAGRRAGGDGRACRQQQHMS